MIKENLKRTDSKKKQQRSLYVITYPDKTSMNKGFASNQIKTAKYNM